MLIGLMNSLGLWSGLTLILSLIALIFLFARPLLGVSRAIDWCNSWIGHLAAWFILFAVIVSTGNAIVRYAFNSSSNAWLEIQWIFFSVTFLLCAAWTLLSHDHIRIDILNSHLPRSVRSAIELIGHSFFLLPLCFVMIKLGWPFFYSSFLQNEQSPNANGLPVWPSKLLVPLAFAILFVQAISEIIKRVAIMRGLIEETGSGGGQQAAAEAEAARLQEALAAEAEKRAEAAAAIQKQ